MLHPKKNISQGSAGTGHFYAGSFAPQEASDLEALPENSSLLNEIGMMRVIIRRLFKTATDQADDLEDWRQAVSALGAACGRLSALIKTERELNAAGADPAALLRQALTEVLQELDE